MGPNKLILCMCFVYAATQVQGQRFLSRSLVEYISQKSNPDVLPQTSADRPVEVRVSLNLIDIKEVSQKRNEVEVDAWLALSWNGRLRWTPSRFNNLHDVRIPVSQIWVPDMSVFNGELSYLETMSHDQAVMMNTGDVIWIPQTRFRVMCGVSADDLLTNATCSIKIGSWSYHGDQISIKDDMDLDVSEYFSDSQYEILSVSAKKEEKIYACCPERYPSANFFFSFRKK